MSLFKKKSSAKSYDKDTQKPVIKASICNGEQVAGFKDLHTGKFEEVMLICSAADLDAFRAMYRITEEIHQRILIYEKREQPLSETSEKRLEKVRFMNMCMIQDGRGNVLALDKVNDSYTGTTFPGGHVEPGELFFQSMIREVWEETGLTIENPEFRGLYHWHKDGVHHVITLYRAYTFCGELESSEEGRVYWISLEELKTKKLASGMEYVLEMMESETIKECYVRREADRYVGNVH